MTLVKTKKRVTPVQKRITGEHHKKSRKYAKAYWPYLPIAFIISGAVIADSYLSASIYSTGNAKVYGARIYTLLGSQNELVLVLLYISIISLSVWYIVRHIKRVKKMIATGERALARYYALDVLMGLMLGVLYILVS